MATIEIITPVESTGEQPVVRTISLDDLKQALFSGLADFMAMPTHVIFLCVIYPIAGLLIGRATFGYDVVPLLYPLAAGFALIGPFAAIGLYELSRRREASLDTSWKHAFDVVHSPSFKSILALGLLLLTLFVIWIAVAHSIYISSFGYAEPENAATFMHQVLTTPEGRRMIVVGNLVGFLFAVIALTVSAISFPLLLDRHVSVATAILTSARVVAHNPYTMAVWGLFVAGGLFVGMLPLFLGLAVVIPVLGHATWHLYRRAVEPDDGPRPQLRDYPKGVRYAAEFPSSLFASSRNDPGREDQ